MPHQTPISPNPLKFRDKGAASDLRTNLFMSQYRNSPVQKRTGSAAASLMAAISSGRKMVKAEVLENQNENRRTDERQETLLELEVQAANRRIECGSAKMPRSWRRQPFPVTRKSQFASNTLTFVSNPTRS